MELLPGAMDRMQDRLFEELVSAYAHEWMKARLLEAIRDTDEVLAKEDAD